MSSEDNDCRSQFDVSKSTLNADAEEFVPSLTETSNVVSEEEELVDDLVEFNTMTCLVEMCQRPHDFEDIFSQYEELLIPCLESDAIAEKLATTLIRVCDTDPNSRYISVKLAQKLNCRSLNRLFILSLLDNTEKKFCSLVQNIKEVKPKELENFALFLGELYVQFEDNNNMRYKVLRDAVVDLSQKMLESNNEQFLYSLGLLLKLVGQSLQEDCGSVLEQLVVKIGALSLGDLNLKTKCVLESVMRMQNEMWHLTEKNSNSTNNSDIECGTVFYGPDGSVISSEECNFLSACLEPEESDKNFNCENNTVKF